MARKPIVRGTVEPGGAIRCGECDSLLESTKAFDAHSMAHLACEREAERRAEAMLEAIREAAREAR